MLNPKQYALSENEHERIFREDICPDLFQYARTNLEKPIAIIFGGQPGSGKTSVVDLAVEELKTIGGCALIVGDELRDYHPLYQELMTRDDQTAAFFTNYDAGRWVEKALLEAKERRCHVVFESTMRVPENVLNVIQLARSANYAVDIRALAVNEKLSWQGVLLRYENQRLDRGSGRMTLPEFHQGAYVGMLDSIDQIENEKRADRMTLYRRGEMVIYENSLEKGEWRFPPQAREILEAERNRAWTLEEHQAYAKGFDQLRDLLKNPERNATAEEIAAMQALREDAYRALDQVEQRIESAHAFRNKPSLEAIKQHPDLAPAYGAWHMPKK